MDAFQGHGRNTKTSVSGQIGTVAQIPDIAGVQYSNGGNIVSDGIHGVPRISSETRPLNVALHPVIVL